MVRRELGKFDEAIADFDEALWLDPKDARTYNERGLDLATKAAGLTDWKDVRVLDTLAAAYAEVGSFDEAIKWQEKVVDLTTAKEGKAAAKEHLELYREHRPLRE